MGGLFLLCESNKGLNVHIMNGRAGFFLVLFVPGAFTFFLATDSLKAWIEKSRQGWWYKSSPTTTALAFRPKHSHVLGTDLPSLPSCPAAPSPNVHKPRLFSHAQANPLHASESR